MKEKLYTEMTPSELLKALGMDAGKWLNAFCAYVPEADKIDRETLRTWVANMIMAGYDHARGVPIHIEDDRFGEPLVKQTPIKQGCRELAKDYAERCGWKNDNGFQVVHVDDLVKAFLAFSKQAYQSRPQDALDEDKLQNIMQRMSNFFFTVVLKHIVELNAQGKDYTEMPDEMQKQYAKYIMEIFELKPLSRPHEDFGELVKEIDSLPKQCQVYNLAEAADLIYKAWDILAKCKAFLTNINPQTKEK